MISACIVTAQLPIVQKWMTGQSLYSGSASNNSRTILSHVLLIYLDSLLSLTVHRPQVESVDATGLMVSVAKIQQPNTDGCQIPIYSLLYIQSWELESVQMRDKT